MNSEAVKGRLASRFSIFVYKWTTHKHKSNSVVERIADDQITVPIDAKHK
jgi:predicted O-linked N-acetylglucosamine transferase (SPINDLY family)